jgi:tetratricopeptide (TPR) repeat protein
MHKSDLERKLRTRGFKVIGPQQVVQSVSLLKNKKSDDLLKAQDIAAILAESWDSSARATVSQERAERLLKRLLNLSDKDPKSKAWGEYFSARHKMLGGDLAGARVNFERIAGLRQLSRFPFKGSRWRHYLTLQQAALLELGRIADLEGRRAEAIEHYNQLLSLLTLPEYSEDYHSDYLFYATAYAAIRGLTYTPYTKTLELEKVVANSETVPTTTATQSSEELKKALNLSRTGKWLEAAVLIEDFLKKDNVSLIERCEGYVIAASVYTRDKKAVEARRHLKSFDAECDELSKESWVFQRRKQIEELLK